MKRLAQALSLFDKQAIGLEEQTDGVTRVEIEHVFYAKIVNMDELKKATRLIKQEQWMLKIQKNDRRLSAGQIRTRKNIEEGKPYEYVMTIKVNKSDGSRLENSIDVQPEMLEIFRQLSDSGMIKHRYEFPRKDGGHPWEFDVFLKPDGTYHEFCKIDLEVANTDAPIPEFPIELDFVIKEEGDKTPDAARKRITELYDLYFLTLPDHYTTSMGGNQISEGTEHSETSGGVRIK